MDIKYQIYKILGKKDHIGESEFQKIISAVDTISSESKDIMIASTPTGYSWLGVYNGGKSLMPFSLLDIPQYYSHSLLSDKQILVLSKYISDKNFRNIIFNGFPLYFRNIARIIGQNNKTSKISIFYHGFLAELAESPISINIFKEIIKLCDEGIINKMAFAKKGFAITFEKLFNIKCFDLIYKNPDLKFNTDKEKEFNDGKYHIGVLVNNSFRKNFHTQILAALMVDNSIVHVLDDSSLNYLNEKQKTRIITHKLLMHNDFIRLLGSMSLNIHATFSEASGGQVCSESISQGVPCISAYTSSFFDYDKELFNKLVVYGHDDSYNIYQKIMEVIPEIIQLSEKCKKYSEYMNVLAKQKLEDFLTY